MPNTVGSFKKNIQSEAVCLGHNAMASLTKPVDATPARSELGMAHTLRVMTSSTMDEPGGYCPPESVTIQGMQLLQLRDFLNEHYPVEPENPDLVLWLQKAMRVRATFKYDINFLETRERETEAAADMNSLGKMFYDRGFAVTTVRDQGEQQTQGLTIVVEPKS